MQLGALPGSEYVTRSVYRTRQGGAREKKIKEGNGAAADSGAERLGFRRAEPFYGGVRGRRVIYKSERDAGNPR